MGARVLVEWIAVGAGRRPAARDGRMALDRTRCSRRARCCSSRGRRGRSARAPRGCRRWRRALALAAGARRRRRTSVGDRRAGDPDHVGAARRCPLRTRRSSARVAAAPRADATAGRSSCSTSRRSRARPPAAWGRIRVRIRGEAGRRALRRRARARDDAPPPAELREPRALRLGRPPRAARRARHRRRCGIRRRSSALGSRAARGDGAGARALARARCARAIAPRSRRRTWRRCSTALVLGDERGIVAAAPRGVHARRRRPRALGLGPPRGASSTAAAAGLVGVAARSQRARAPADGRPRGARRRRRAGRRARSTARSPGFAVADAARGRVMAGVVVAARARSTAAPTRCARWRWRRSCWRSAAARRAGSTSSFQLSFVSVAAIAAAARAPTRAPRGRRTLARLRGGASPSLRWLGTAPLTAFHFHQVSLVERGREPAGRAALRGGRRCSRRSPARSWSRSHRARRRAPSPSRRCRSASALAIVAARRRAGRGPPSTSRCRALLELVLLYGAARRARGIAAAPAARLLRGAAPRRHCVVDAAVVGARARWGARAARDVPRRRAGRRGGRRARGRPRDRGRRGRLPGGDFDTGAALVEPFLRPRKILRVDALVMTHAHPDHAGGLAHLRAPLRAGASSGGPASPGAGRMGRARAGARASGDRRSASLARGRRGRRLPEVERAPSAAPRGRPRRSNDGSLVAARSASAASRVLLTGDVEARRRGAPCCARRRASRAAVLKVPHHGSRTSSAPAVRGRGRAGGRGHRRWAPTTATAIPRPTSRRATGRAGRAFCRTDRCGAVTVRDRRRGLRVETARPGCGCPATVRSRRAREPVLERVHHEARPGRARRASGRCWSGASSPSAR